MRWAMIILAVICLFCWWRIDALSDALKAERTAHAATMAKAEGWKKAYEQRGVNETALSDLADSCLQREAAARAAATERETIMKEDIPQPKPTDTKVISNATRKKIADRLNRPL